MILPKAKILAIVVAETLNFSQTPHFRCGGALHLAVNNQVGFTTTHEKARSSRYCTDVAKLVSAPVIHVNGDKPELVLKATRLAMKYRQLFRKDIFIDLVCFRMWGHNELDDPTFTQPHMYSRIKPRETETVPMKYCQNLINDGIMTAEDAGRIVSGYMEKLQSEFNKIDSYVPENTALKRHWSDVIPAPNAVELWDTGVDVEVLRNIAASSVAAPESVTVHDHLKKIHVDARQKKAADGTGFDFGSAEALAFGSLLQKGYSVRISGQDVGRGTFSQRHVVLTDQSVEDQQYIPLNHMSDDQPAFIEVANSILSEEATLGFEYGMSIESPERLVVWEAQFGDFFNGAQIMIDTFVTCGETKWLLQSGLVMLLPHGLDGAGPEHSSCRMERFLQLTDSKEASVDGSDVNFEFVQPTTAAQYFHLLRRQMVRKHRKPLIVASPKLILRLPAACSALTDMGPNTCFRTVLPDPSAVSPSNVRKVIFCSGKHFYALDKERTARKLTDVAIVRLEALCPFPFVELQAEMSKYSNCSEFVWSQEEARNSGAWTFVAPRFQNLLGVQIHWDWKNLSCSQIKNTILEKKKHYTWEFLKTLYEPLSGHTNYVLRYAGRPEMPIPAVAIGQIHAKQVQELMNQSFS